MWDTFTIALNWAAQKNSNWAAQNLRLGSMGAVGWA